MKDFSCIVFASVEYEVLKEFLESQEKFEIDLKKKTDEDSSKVAIVLKRAEEQGQMIESLHTSVSLPTIQISSPLQPLLH